ncbi:hypothetical protein GCM10010431_03710 [Streptomyces kunmingensis]
MRRVLSGTGVLRSDVDHVSRVAIVGLCGVIQQRAGFSQCPLHNDTEARAPWFNSPDFFRKSLLTCADQRYVHTAPRVMYLPGHHLCSGFSVFSEYAG